MVEILEKRSPRVSAFRQKSAKVPPDLSIIIVSYNVREDLDRCLSSVRAASRNLSVETIVVDNASGDGSAAMAREKHGFCAVLDAGGNLGFSRASNIGLRRSAGRYLLLLNPDTVLEPDVLEKMKRTMEAHPDTGMGTCKLVTEDGSLDLACRRSFPSLWDGFCRACGLSGLFPKSRFFARYNLTFLDENTPCDVEAVNGAFMFVRREAFDEVGPLDEDYFMYVEDLDWCYRFREAGFRIVYCPEATTLHLKGKSGMQRSPEMIRRLFESTEIFYRKHYFPGAGFLKKGLILAGLRLWLAVALLKNTLRKKKRTRP